MGMVRVTKARLDEVGHLLTDWPYYTSEAVRDPARNLAGTPEMAWASRVTGEAVWAFEKVHEALPTEDLQAALSVVVHWGMAGLLHSVFLALDGSPQLVEKFTARLEDGGFIPYTFVRRASC